MTRDDIIELVQKKILSKNLPTDFTKINTDSECPLTHSQGKVASRLLDAYARMKKGMLGKEDFELALRDYLLHLRTQLVIPEYSPSSVFESLQLKRNSETGDVWASFDMPSYLNGMLVKKAFLPDTECFRPNTDWVKPLNPYLHEKTGFLDFKSEEQKLLVMGALNALPGSTTLFSMSTGGGKSLITISTAFQCKNSLSIIIVPTISLMQDQVLNARRAVRPTNSDEILLYNSSENVDDVIHSLKKKTVRMLFLSPESLIKNPKLRSALEQANENHYLKNLVIDEAHIICEWGASFRLDFQCLDGVRKRFLNANPELRTFLLSATFSKKTVEQLKLFFSEGDNWNEIRCDKLREETVFDVIKAASYSEKKRRIHEMIRILPHPMIVYVQTPKQAEDLLNELNQEGFRNVRTFTGLTDNTQREILIREWSEDRFPIMIATCAFGVGVDKPDVRTVLHSYVPENPNKYYQEAGRGGRDGFHSLSAVVYTEDDMNAAFSFTQKVITEEKLSGRWFSMLHSTRTINKGNGVFVIDTSVKPVYNENETYVDWANDTDVYWNVNVLLLLKRNRLIDILDVTFDNSRYFFVIHVNQAGIVYNTEETHAVLQTVRDREWNYNQAEFNMMKKALKRSGKDCLSEVFCAEYPLAYQYCAGCNSHYQPIDDGINAFPLKKKCSVKGSTLQNSFCEMLGEATSGLVLADSIQDGVNRLCSRGVDTFVNLPENVTVHSKNPLVLTLSFNEFRDYLQNGEYYLNRCIVIVMPVRENQLIPLLTILDKQEKTPLGRIILLSTTDAYVSVKGKNLSEIIQGPCIQSYLLED